MVALAYCVNGLNGGVGGVATIKQFHLWWGAERERFMSLSRYQNFELPRLSLRTRQITFTHQMKWRSSKLKSSALTDSG
jgi:hypothetical protein